MFFWISEFCDQGELGECAQARHAHLLRDAVVKLMKTLPGGGWGGDEGMRGSWGEGEVGLRGRERSVDM